jgi:hypothetical protein
MQMKEKIFLWVTGLLLGTNHGCITTSPNQSLLQCGTIPVHLQPKSSKFKVTPSVGKVMHTVFWDSQGVLLAHFQKHGENVKFASYCEVFLKLLDAVHREHPWQCQTPYSPSNPGENSSTTVGSSWTFALQPRLGPKSLPSVWSAEKPRWQMFRLWQRGWNGGVEVAETKSKDSMLQVSFYW